MTTPDMEFGTEAACAEYLLAQIPAQTLSQEARLALASGLATQFKAPDPEVPEGGFPVIVGRWVIRDDDLKAFEEFVRAITAAAGATFFFDHTKILAAGVGVAVAVFSIFRNARRSSAFLSNDELVILWAVKGADRRRPRISDLVPLLADRPKSDGAPWVEESIQGTLEHLEKYPTPSGLKKFVARDAEGGWGLEGV